MLIVLGEGLIIDRSVFRSSLRKNPANFLRIMPPPYYAKRDARSLEGKSPEGKSSPKGNLPKERPRGSGHQIIVYVSETNPYSAPAAFVMSGRMRNLTGNATRSSFFNAWLDASKLTAL